MAKTPVKAAKKVARKITAKISTTHPGFTFVQKLAGISEYKLNSNGLRVLLILDKSAPVAGCMVTYHVGSRNEATGYTGATHLLEHLMFKGSKSFDSKTGNSIDVLLERKGALLNATTWFDRTNYYEVIPKDALPLAIEIEADRMRNAFLREEDRANEMPVVRNEFERGENMPIEALDKEIWAASFIAHPYHHSTIGWRSDIEKVSIERLQQFYNDFYWPNNATVSIAGNFDESETLSLIKKHFGKHPKAPKPFPVMCTEEPKQEGQRRVTVRRAGAPLLGISLKIPNAHHKDIPALLMLASILYEDKTSRLYRSLVDTALATQMLVMVYQLHDPGLFQVFATLAPKVTHAKVEKIILDECESIATKGVTTNELARAKRAARSAIATRRDGAYALLSALNEDIATGDWTRFATLPSAIEKVTAKDIQRVAKAYFVDDQSVVGWFVSADNT
jgi:zinc protease